MHKCKLMNTYLPEAVPMYEAGVTSDFSSGIEFRSIVLCVFVCLGDFLKIFLRNCFWKLSVVMYVPQAFEIIHIFARCTCMFLY